VPVVAPPKKDPWANALCGAATVESAAPIAKTTPMIAMVLVILFILSRTREDRYLRVTQLFFAMLHSILFINWFSESNIPLEFTLISSYRHSFK
jgi:hypothetical protein